MDNEFIIDERMQDLIDTSITQKEKEQTYPVLVNYLIRQKYHEQDVEAIVNNYLDSPGEEKYNQEFKNLQTYRKECKLKAKELLEMN